MLDNVCVHAVNPLDALRRDAFLPSHGIDLAVFQEEEAIAIANRQVDVVHNRAGGDTALVDLTANLLHNLLLVGGIEVVGRLVEQKRLCLLHERPREDHLLVLPAGKLVGIAQRVGGKP